MGVEGTRTWASRGRVRQGLGVDSTPWQPLCLGERGCAQSGHTGDVGKQDCMSDMHDVPTNVAVQLRPLQELTHVASLTPLLSTPTPSSAGPRCRCCATVGGPGPSSHPAHAGAAGRSAGPDRTTALWRGPCRWQQPRHVAASQGSCWCGWWWVKLRGARAGKRAEVRWTGRQMV